MKPIIFRFRSIHTHYDVWYERPAMKSQDINGKEMLKVNEKYYVVDHGLREAVVGKNLENIEIVLENMVGLELLRRGYKVCVGRVGEKEVDFVGEKNGEKFICKCAIF